MAGDGGWGGIGGEREGRMGRSTRGQDGADGGNAACGPWLRCRVLSAVVPSAGTAGLVAEQASQQNGAPRSLARLDARRAARGNFRWRSTVLGLLQAPTCYTTRTGARARNLPPRPA